MADDRLPWRRSPSIEATSSESVRLRDAAMSFSPLQNASSRLTLVLWPVMTIERLTTGDFIRHLPNQSCAHQDAGSASGRLWPADRAQFWSAHERSGLSWLAQRPSAFASVCGTFAD